MALWSGKDLVNNQKDSDRDAEPLQALKNWQYVYQLLEDNIVNSSTVFKIYLALRNAFEPSSTGRNFSSRFYYFERHKANIYLAEKWVQQ